MYFDEIYNCYQRIREKLDDEKSKALYDSWIEYMITRNVDELEAKLLDESVTYDCMELNRYLDSTNRKIVLFGTGQCGIKTIKNLRLCRKYNVVAFCDNDRNKVGKEFCSLPVLAFDELMQHKDDYFVIICSINYGHIIRKQLIENGYCERLILQTQLGYPEIQCGWQYFDVFEPREKEVFLDIGSYDGNTTIDFWKWSSHASERKAICLEPMNEMYRVMADNLRNIDCVIYNYAAWSEDEPLKIAGDIKADGTIWGGSAISKNGSAVVQGRRIDSLSAEIGGDITYIKMDVEGSELAALKGGRKTIEQYAPRLAISLYHKPTDVIEIPTLILQMRKDYRFIIRHYSGNMNETVLYAY